MSYFMALSGKAGQPATFACAVADRWQAIELLASLYAVPEFDVYDSMEFGDLVYFPGQDDGRWFAVQERDDDQAGFVLYSAGG